MLASNDVDIGYDDIVHISAFIITIMLLLLTLCDYMAISSIYYLKSLYK